MLKTLRITTIVAAVLAVMFFVLSVVFGGRNDEEFEKFLNSAGVVEKFKKDLGNQANALQNQISPLVLQSEAFANILNPPPKPGEPEATPLPNAPPVPIKPTAKFTLVGTCVSDANPEMSLAFIDEPGKGPHWVKQGSQIGYVTIEQVKDGVIVVREGRITTEMTAPQNPHTSFLQDSSPVSSITVAPISPPTPVTSLAEPTTSTETSPPAQLTPEAMADFIKSLQEGAKSGEIDTNNAEKFISALGSLRITDDEAEKLKNLPNELDTKHEPNVQEPNAQEPNQTKSNKVEKPVRPVRTIRPRLPQRR